MQRVIKVKFRNTARNYYFDALDFEIKKGDSLIVETTRGEMLGEAVSSPENIEDERLPSPLKPVIRLASSEDLDSMEHFRSKENEALAACQKKIEEHGLEMRLVDAEYAYNGSKLTFYFTADNRVDFRELLKDLTPIFKTRIDLRQIGDRDEAKKCGGLGFCGRPICCSSFLSEFTPVSIKMAKTQNLSLNPLKISGICGKLMCCLRYEQDCYESMQKLMPKCGTEFVTPDGKGMVIENNVVTETTKLKVTLADGTFDIRSYPFRDLLGYNEEASCCCSSCGGECNKHADAPDCNTEAHDDNTKPVEDSGASPDRPAPTDEENKPPRGNKKAKHNFKNGKNRFGKPRPHKHNQNNTERSKPNAAPQE